MNLRYCVTDKDELRIEEYSYSQATLEQVGAATADQSPPQQKSVCMSTPLCITGIPAVRQTAAGGW